MQVPHELSCTYIPAYNTTCKTSNSTSGKVKSERNQIPGKTKDGGNENRETPKEMIRKS